MFALTPCLLLRVQQGRALRLASGQELSLYFGIGLYISTHSREKYWGTGAIEAISEQIRKEMPGLRGFSAENMKKMRTFSEFWSQFINRSPMATDLQKAEDECVIETDLFSLSAPLLPGSVSNVTHAVRESIYTNATFDNKIVFKFESGQNHCF